MSVRYSAANKLVWNPGLSDSRFDFHFNSVVSPVTVDPPHRVIVAATVRIELAFVQLQEHYKVEDIDVSSLACHGARAVNAVVAGDRLVVHFRTADLQGLTPGAGVPITLTGQLRDQSVFTAEDTVRVIR